MAVPKSRPRNSAERQTIKHVRPATGGGKRQAAKNVHFPKIKGAVRGAPPRKILRAAPLGLGTFALCTFVVSILNLEGHSAIQSGVVFALALGYGGIMQLLAGMWEMALGNTFGGTVFSSFGGFWFSFAILIYLHPEAPTEHSNVDIGSFEAGLELYLWGWFIFGTICMLLVLRSTLQLALLFIFSDIASFFGALSISLALRTIPGAGAVGVFGSTLGVFTALIAWYNMFTLMADADNFFCRLPSGHLPWSEEGKREVRKAKEPMEAFGV